MLASTLKELNDYFSSFQNKIEKRYSELKIQELEEEGENLKKNLEDPAFWTNQSKREEMRELQVKIVAIDKKIVNWKDLIRETQDLKEYLEIAIIENEENLLLELNSKIKDLEKKYNTLDLESLLNAPDDFRNAFLNIHPGAGGTESHDWADMLYRAYLRWAESHKFEIQLVDYQEGEEAGVKNVTLLIKGTNTYGFLKAESGVHRLVRISPFDSNKKRHTSFASVHVSPEISDDVKVDINEKDLRIDTYRSSGAGGQHVNKTDSAVRITHNPTGIVVACQNERSQMKNRSTAMKVLKARLYELARLEKQKEIETKGGERKDISWGNQIRSYVFHPYQMVKDQRTNYETGNIQAVMNGDFDPFIDSYLRSKSTIGSS